MLCHERIILTKYSETYCMLPAGHKGEHDPHPHLHIAPTPRPQPSQAKAAD